MKTLHSTYALLLVIQASAPVVLAFLDDEKAFRAEQEPPQFIATGVSSTLSVS